MQGRAVLFDLDGTLTDPFVGITRSLVHAVERSGRPAPDPESLRWCIGPPLRAVIRDLLGTTDEAEIEAGVAFYRERYGTVGKFENTLIEGVPQVLEHLAAEGAFLAVATSKLGTYAGDIIDHFGLSPYFRAVYGSEPDGSNAAKTDLIRGILASEGLDPDVTLMIGDRSHDVVGAAANRVRTIGVRWGYGAPGELEKAGAFAIAERPDELPGLIGRTFGRE